MLRDSAPDFAYRAAFAVRNTIVITLDAAFRGAYSTPWQALAEPDEVIKLRPRSADFA